MPPANAFCASATAIAADMTITGEDISTGGPRPMGTGCGTSDGNSAYYYEVTIPANTQVFVSTDSSGLDRVLLFQDSCAAADCSFRTDSSPESGLLVNATASPVTRIVAVHNYSSGATGTYDITFTYGVIPTVASITAACADLSTATALGVPGDDDASAVTALPFSFDYLGDTTSHFSATSNGFMQLWTSSTGSPSTTFTNGSLPSTATPNGVIAPFWDDLSPNTGADIYTATLGSAGSQRFVVEWRDWSRYEGTEELTFQAHLLEATGEVELHYCTMTPGSDDGYSGSSATIGLENIAGTNGVQISRNTTGAVMTGTGFSITP
jgi:hypothetical protein